MTTRTLSGGTYDWGQAVNRALDDMDEGDILIIPEREFRTTTPAVLDVPKITIRSRRVTGREGWLSTPPLITSEGITGPMIEVRETAAIQGLSFNGSNDNANPYSAIEAHSGFEARDIVATRMGAHTIHCHVSAPGEGTNTSRMHNISGKLNFGSVVEATKSDATASRNTNAMEIHVRTSFQNHGWGVNIGNGIGNTIHVSQVEGGNHTGAVRLGDNLNRAYVSYMESNINQGVVFDDNTNHAQVLHSGLADDLVFIDNGGNNRWEFLDSGKRGSSYRDHEFEGSHLQHTTAGRGITLTSPDGLTTKTFGLRNDGTFGELI